MIEPSRHPDLAALVTHARAVSSEEREAFGTSAASLAGDPRTILIRTCHRVELYVTGAAADEALARRLPTEPRGGRRLEGDAAVRHLLTVAAGLDSVVVGEDQILHQLRDSLSQRHLPSAVHCPEEIGSTSIGAASLDPVLERLFQVALHLGRETRSWREAPPRSLADLVMERIHPITGPLTGRRLLVVGAGQMARLAALAAARDDADVLVANRTPERAAVLAQQTGGRVVSFDAAPELGEVDAIVLAIGGPWPLAADARKAFLGGSAPVVDLSSPPAVDPGLRELLGARYTSIDDLARGPQDAMRARLARRYQRAIDDAAIGFEHWYRSRAAVPAIQALSELAEERRSDELERLFRRLELDDRERELVVQMSHRLVAGLLHAPLVTLRDDTSGELEQAARTLFSL